MMALVSSLPGVQWTTVVEPSYPRFALTPCQTIGISAGNPNSHNTNNPSNSSSNNTTTGSAGGNGQQQQQQQLHQHQQAQSHHASSNEQHQTSSGHHHSSAGVVTHSNGGQNASTSSDVVNQSSVASSSGGSSRDDGVGSGSGLQQYQQQGGEGSSSGTAYQSTSGTTQIINNYPQSISTPTSPQCTDGTLVQSVYSQGTTPIQSPGATSSAGTTTPRSGGASAGTNSATSKRKRSVNPQGDENFIRALEAVRYGGIGFCKAARLFGVNNRTLWLEYRKRGYPISRPSIKSRVKQEPDASPQPPTTPVTKEEPKMDTSSSSYEHSGTSTPGQATTTSTNIQMPIVGSAEGGTSIMCPPHAHSSMGVMSFLDARHVEFPGATIHSTMRQRYPETTAVNVNPGAAINLGGINFNNM